MNRDYGKKSAKIGTLPPENDRNLAAVAELAAVAGDGHAAEGGAAEVEVSAAVGAVAAGALVGDDDRHRPPRADRAVQAPDLVARAAPLAALEQHRAHRTHARAERLHVHQRAVAARATVAAVALGAPVPGGRRRGPMRGHGRGGAQQHAEGEEVGESLHNAAPQQPQFTAARENRGGKCRRCRQLEALLGTELRNFLMWWVFLVFGFWEYIKLQRGVAFC